MVAPAFQSVQFGGVDSRSNPINMPQERCIRCKNWIIEEAGNLRLRDGYSKINHQFADTIVGVVFHPAIHSIFPYQILGGHKLAIVGYGNYLGTWDFTSSVAADQISYSGDLTGEGDYGSGKWQWALSGGKIFGVNGSFGAWFDGTTVYQTGLAALTSGDVTSVVVTEGVRELTAAERTASGVAVSAGGSFPADTYGRMVYCVLFDPSQNERGPSTLALKTTRVKPALNNKIDLTGLPNVSASLAGYKKLFSITGDGTVPAYFCTNTSTNITNITTLLSTATVAATAHGLSAGDVVIIAGNSVSAYNEVWSVASVPDADHVTITLQSWLGTPGTGTGGTIKRIVSVSDAATTGTISAPTTDSSIVANADRGIPASAVTASSTTNPGYQFYLSRYRKLANGHVGNRVAIGNRIVNTTRCNVRIAGLPNLVNPDSLYYLIGRTGDGGVVPYAVMDSGANWISSFIGNTAITITQPSTDGAAELPTRNGVPPAMDKIVRVGDYLYGNEANSATIRRSGSEQSLNQGYFVGVPAESWADNDIDTFPTGEAVTCLAEQDYELVAWSLNDMAILSDVSGIMGWRGPWNVGCAGKRATTQSPYGRFWVTGDKQLATVKNGIPVSISGEYEKALLSKIGDAYLSDTEIVYEKNVALKLDRLIIKAKDGSGIPFLVYHDFKLMDGRSPEGQAYETVYVDALASDFTIAQIRDANGSMKILAGGSDAYLYQLDSGGNDNGTEFSADYISLINLGIGRQAIKGLSWQGDQKVGVSLATRLNKTTTDTVLCGEGEAIACPDNFGADNFKWTHTDPIPSPELLHAYLRLQLTSHSADGDMDLNDPPHLPLEDYGRIYAMQFGLGQERGAR